MMIKKILNLHKEVLYRDEAADKYYRRIVGGLAWPDRDQPGYLVVLAEGLRKDAALGAHVLEVVDERPALSIEDLHRGCRELRAQSACDLWLAELENLEAKKLFLLLNQNLDDRARVWLRAGAYSGGSLQALVQLLDGLLRNERTILSFGSKSVLPQLLLSLQPEQLTEPLRRWPGLAALGFAAAEMVLRLPRERRAPGPEVVCNTVPANWR